SPHSTLSLHDALPIFLLQGAVEGAEHADRNAERDEQCQYPDQPNRDEMIGQIGGVSEDFAEAIQQRALAAVEQGERNVTRDRLRSEEHTSELQSPCNL